MLLNGQFLPGCGLYTSFSWSPVECLLVALRVSANRPGIACRQDNRTNTASISFYFLIISKL